MGGLLENKVAVVTGGCRGIGEAISLRFAENGATVVIADVDLSRAPEVIERVRGYGGEAEAIHLDVSNVEEIQKQCDYIVERYGRIDVWVNNAGVTENVPIEDLTEQQWDRLLDIDLKGAFFCSQAAYRVMMKQKGGKIVNLGSVAGERGGRFAGAHYSVAKAGVLALTKCFALNGGDYDIHVNAIAPGLIETQMAAQLGFLEGEHKDVPLQRLGKPADVANAALYLASGLSDYVTGMIVDVNGGMFMR